MFPWETGTPLLPDNFSETNLGIFYENQNEPKKLKLG